MANLTEVYGKFANKWKTSSAIQRDSKLFINETNGIIEALGNRIDKENK